MELKINREIRNYKESVFFGLSMRQFSFSLLACGAAVGAYFAFRNALGTEGISWACMAAAAPFAALGFVKYNGMTAGKLLRVWLKSAVLTPRILTFRAANLYYDITKTKGGRNK